MASPETHFLDNIHFYNSDELPNKLRDVDTMTSLLLLSELKNNGLKWSDLQDVQHFLLGVLLPLSHANLTWVYTDPMEKGQFDFLIQAGSSALVLEQGKLQIKSPAGHPGRLAYVCPVGTRSETSVDVFGKACAGAL